MTDVAKPSSSTRGDGTSNSSNTSSSSSAASSSNVPSSTSTPSPSSSSSDADVVVIDIGTGSIKAGWAGEDAPRCIIPTLLLDQHNQTMPVTINESGQHGSSGGGNSGAAGDRGNDYTVGHAAIQALHRTSSRSGSAGSGANSNLNPSLLHPLSHGEIIDYDSVQKIFEHIFKNELHINPKEHPILLTVSPLSSPESRLELAKMMFEVFSVPSLCLMNQAVLSLYSTGRTTGLVLEVGEGMIYCTPIYEGFAIRHAVLSIPVAGDECTRYLLKNLNERVAKSGGGGVGGEESGANTNRSGSGENEEDENGDIVSSSDRVIFNETQFDIVRDIKEKLCRVRVNGKEDEEEEEVKSSRKPIDEEKVNDLNPDGTPVVPSTTTQPSQPDDETSYELPDGRMIRLDKFCQYSTYEILFRPQIYAQALGLTLTGGLNQCYGIPNQKEKESLGGLASSGSAGGAQVGATTTNATALQQPGSAGGIGSIGSFPLTFGSNGGGGNIRQNISIDLSTNELLGVHQLLYHSLHMIDIFLRKELCKNIILAGGTSMAKGFGERVKKELVKMFVENGGGGNAAAAAITNTTNATGSVVQPEESLENTLNIITDSQRKYAAWIGASMYASLPTFGIIKITAEQYKRDESIVHKKFF